MFGFPLQMSGELELSLLLKRGSRRGTGQCVPGTGCDSETAGHSRISTFPTPAPHRPDSVARSRLSFRELSVELLIDLRNL